MVKFQGHVVVSNFRAIHSNLNIGNILENYITQVSTHTMTNQISDYAWFSDFFTDISDNVVSGDLDQAISECAETLKHHIPDMMLFEPNPEYSKFFKFTYVPPKRYGAMVTEKQIQELMKNGR